jgi:hypothetical protein
MQEGWPMLSIVIYRLALTEVFSSLTWNFKTTAKGEPCSLFFSQYNLKRTDRTRRDVGELRSRYMFKLDLSDKLWWHRNLYGWTRGPRRQRQTSLFYLIIGLICLYLIYDHPNVICCFYWIFFIVIYYYF